MIALGKKALPRDAVAFVCAPLMASCLKTSDAKDAIRGLFGCGHCDYEDVEMLCFRYPIVYL